MWDALIFFAIDMKNLLLEYTGGTKEGSHSTAFCHIPVKHM